MANQQACQEVFDYLIAHPEHHEQSSWANPCGTTMCAAGCRAFLDGKLEIKPGEFATGNQNVLWNGDSMGELSQLWSCDFVEYKERYGTDIFPMDLIPSHAAKSMGLTKQERNFLFYQTTNEMALLTLKRLANGEPLDDLYELVEKAREQLREESQGCYYEEQELRERIEMLFKGSS
jgi:hypothetical protein